MKNTSYISLWDGTIAISPEKDGVWICILRTGASINITLEPAQALQIADALRAAAIVNTEPAQVAE